MRIGRRAHFKRGLLLHRLVLMVAGTTLAWHKASCSIETDWIEYYLKVDCFEVGNSESRAPWAIR